MFTIKKPLKRDRAGMPNQFQKENLVESLMQVRGGVNMPVEKTQFKDSNCVVHDDTHDWGGKDPFMREQEELKESYHQSLRNKAEREKPKK